MYTKLQVQKCAYKLICYEIKHGQVAQLVERLCSHLKVTGSTPVPVSILLILISIAKNAIWVIYSKNRWFSV